MPLKESRGLSRDILVATLLLTAVCALLYGHTLDVPFYLDDYGILFENYLLRDLPATVTQLFSRRGLTNLSFALNYRLSGWSLDPLHLVNIALHAGCGFLVWLLLRQLLAGRWLPLCGALIFIAHPLQTQGVTYLVQRSTLLATLCVLAAVLLHRRARGVLVDGGHRKGAAYLRPYLCAVLLGGGALLAKENAAALPLLLMAHDRLFPLPGRNSWRQVFLDSLPYWVAPLTLAGFVLPALLSGAERTSQSGGLLSLQHNHSLNYLFTQFEVLWVYLRLLLLPYGQALEHDFPVVAQPFNPLSLAAMAGWVVVAWLLWRLRRNKPLLVFGAVWFFCGLAVESSLIPLDPLFEHRLYLAFPGFVLVVTDGLISMLGERRTVVALTVAMVSYLPLTWQRNALWREPIAFYEDNRRIAPCSERAAMALMLLYKDAGRVADAERLARELMTINPHFGAGWRELAGLLTQRGAGEEALGVVEDGLLQLPGDPDLYRAGAAVYLAQGQLQTAVEFLRRGVESSPRSPAMLDWLAALYLEVGQLPEAEATFRASLRLNEKSAATHKNLAKALYAQGRMPEALSELRLALALTPGSPDILEGVAMAALAIGDRETAEQAAAKLHYSDPAAWQEVQAMLTSQR